MIYNTPSNFIKDDGTLDIQSVTRYVIDEYEADPSRQQIRLPIDSTSLAVLRKSIGVVNNTTPQGGVILPTSSLVNGIVSGYVKSDNYVAGSTGWSIKGDGSAEFSNVTVRGYVAATSGTIGGFTINTTAIQDIAGTFGMSSAVTGGDDIRFWAGHATPSSAPFSVTEAGVLKATSGTIGGFTLSSTQLYAGTGATRIQLDTGAGIHLGATAFADAPFSVTRAGALKATSGTIANWTLSSSAISTGAFDTISTMYFGTSGLSLSNTFKVTSTGILTATDAILSGTITASAGSIGGWTIDANSLYATTTGTIKTSALAGVSASGVILDKDGLRGYNDILTKVFDIPTDGSAPTFSSGLITETIFSVSTNAVIRTSPTVGDGTVDSNGVLMNYNGFYACAANQTPATANVRILTDGSAYFSGTFEIGGATKTVGTVAEIQPALDELEATGGTLYLKAGTYNLTSDIYIPSGCNLEGTARDNCIIECGNYSIIMSGSDAYSTGTITIDDGETEVVGSGTTWTEDMVGQSIWIDYNYYEITGFTDTTHLTIEEYSGVDISDETYVIATIVYNPQITKLTIQNSSGAGIQSYYSDNPQLDDLSVYGCDIGIDMKYSVFPELLTFNIENGINLVMDYINGFFINYSSFDFSTSGEGIKISNTITSSMYLSSCGNNTTHGLSLDNCDNNTFFDCDFFDNNESGIYIISNSDDNTFLAIGANNNGGDGIAIIEESDTNNISSCIIKDNNGFGLNINSATCNNNSIIGNTATGNVSGIYYDVGTDTYIIADGVINNSVYTVANLPVTRTVVGFNSPSAYE
jgi:parallel beta-helix repeat protein